MVLNSSATKVLRQQNSNTKLRQCNSGNRALKKTNPNSKWMLSRQKIIKKKKYFVWTKIKQASHMSRKAIKLSFCTRNPKKPSKNQLLLSCCTCLPKFGYGMTKPQKSMWHYWKMKIFFFCVFYTVWTFSHPKMKSCSFSISSQFNFKNRHFFQAFKLAKWKF